MSVFDLGPSLGSDPLDVLRYALEVADLDGIAAEFGVASGRSLRLIAERFPGRCYGFDSFDGLPEDWRPGFPLGMFACAPPYVPGAELVIGEFDAALRGWTPGRLALVHIDCDLYSSTATVLQHLVIAPALGSGTVIVFDEFHGYPGCEEHEQRAWAEFLDGRDVAYDALGHGPEQWAVRIR